MRNWWPFLFYECFGLAALVWSVLLAIFIVVVCLVAEAGSSHRRASNFLVRDKKVTKEARLPTAVRRNSLCAYSASLKQPPEK